MDDELTNDEQAIAKRIRIEDEINGWLGFGLSLLFLAIPVIFGLEALLWLRTAEWPGWTWGNAFAWAGPLDIPHGRGLEKILRWLAELPLWTLPMAAIGILAATWFHDRPEDAEVRRVRMKLANIRDRKAKDTEL